MRILYFDCFAGVSGDMTVGALIALGVELALIERALACLPVGGYRLRAEERVVHGLRATKFDVDLDNHEDEHDHDAGHAHRSYADIRAMLQGSRLEARAKDLALAIFARLAEAEGRVHGVPAAAVTFHEVGAVDSIVDIVGAAVGVTALDVERAYVSALPLGSGTVRSQHGVIPVPGPATVELLRGFPVRLGDGGGELVTPTGAAIVATLAAPGEAVPPMRIEAAGYGAGTRVLPDRANVLRLLLGRALAGPLGDELVEIATNIDDSSPEIYEHVLASLFAAGARDAWLTPAQMKKNRPGVVLHALAEPAAREVLAGIILRETSAIGVRFTAVQRRILPRRQVSVETPYGAVLVKLADAPDGTVNVAPEYDDCRRIALERGVALKVVYQAAIAAALAR
jgi:hypothetical protein